MDSLAPFVPDLMVILALSLDDPSIFKPGMDIHTSGAQAWDHYLDKITAKKTKEKKTAS